MNTHNVKTAASESTETWVKQNFDVHLVTRTNRRFSLAKLEGDLMKHRAMEKLGVNTEDLFDDLQMAASCISTMINKGDIVTRSGYELASSVRSLAIELYPEAWEAVDGPDLPELAWLQADAPGCREAERQSYIEIARPFGVTVCGSMEFHEDDRNYGTYWQEGVICLGRADTIAEAMELLVQADLNNDWQLSDYDALSFQPKTVTITDLAHRIVLRGNASKLEWTVPETDPIALERIAGQKEALLSKAAYESGWDNYETARMLRSEANLLELGTVHAVWLNDPEVAKALREYRHPSKRLDETELMENLEF
ncbi:hypothetical protein [Pantoea agglomerans]|uniref:hypothetical protein n=1 Tax=Enterobacter agglomerans TaxID=549 RepID=UPI003209C193